MFLQNLASDSNAGIVQTSLMYMFIFLRPPPPPPGNNPPVVQGEGGGMLIAYCYCYSYDFPNFVPRFNQHFSPSTVPLEGGPSAIYKLNCRYQA